MLWVNSVTLKVQMKSIIPVLSSVEEACVRYGTFSLGMHLLQGESLLLLLLLALE